MGLGILVNTLSVLLGSIFGTLLRKRIPVRLSKALPVGFGVSAITIGIASVVKLNNLTAVIMAVLLGLVIGTILRIEDGVKSGFEKILYRKENDHIDMQLYLTATTLFVCSGMGWYGAISEGIYGSSDILLSKSVLDFLTAMVFGTTLGWSLCLIPIPQAAVLILLFCLGRSLSGVVKPDAFADFKAVGGVVSIASGLRVAKIAEIKTIDLIPALIIIIPLSVLLGRVM